MKHRLFGLFILLASCSANAQNSLPTISNVVVSVDSIGGRIVIDYDSDDSDNDALDVGLRISSDSGRSYLVPVHRDSLSGDVGYPIASGSGKQIVWRYDRSRISGNLMAKVVVDDRQPYDIQSLVDAVDSNRMKSDLQAIVGVRHRTAGVAQLMATKEITDNHFGVHGLRKHQQEFIYAGYRAHNIIGDIPGELGEDTVYILGAHYDTQEDSPGADDNGSGVVGMLEAVRVLSSAKFRNTIRFIGFDLEEEELIGSQRYVTSIGTKERVRGMLDFEMIGYYSDQPNSQQMPAGFSILFPAASASVAADSNRGNFLTNVANQSSNWLKDSFDLAARTYVPELRVISLSVPGTGSLASDLRRSDHAPFWDAGIPALMLTDGANFRNPNYHSPSDTIGTLDFTFMSRSVKATVGTLARIGGVLHGGSATSELFHIGGTSRVAERRTSSALLEQNAPNPASGMTTIRYHLPHRGAISIRLFDIVGRDVATLVEKIADEGEGTVVIDAEKLAPGTYVYRMVFDGMSVARRLVR